MKPGREKPALTFVSDAASVGRKPGGTRWSRTGNSVPGIDGGSGEPEIVLTETGTDQARGQVIRRVRSRKLLIDAATRQCGGPTVARTHST